MRIDINGARIFRPVMDFLRLVQDNMFVGENCDYEAMFACYIKKGRDEDPLWGSCADAHNCKPDVNLENEDFNNNLQQRR